MSYLVLARKWRPMTFSDLVGQEHVSRTISNAILTGRVAHAFLFTGVRGVGKTTSARILAKALNCEKGPTAEPCLQCPACKEIALGSDVDVQEIDGASYNGVDEVRRLQESLPYRPARDRFKIVIVDEVHMLSQNAWNAFLKTLEEPPPHVKFIFATTEVHKVPVTILSRCQRYDFKLIAAQVIGKRLRYVLTQERIEADDAAISLLAREAAGSMRDAMSLLDQAIAWGGEKLVGEDIARVLGVAGLTVFRVLAGALVRADAVECLQIVDRIADQGFDLVHVARNMLVTFRDLVVVKVCKDPERLVDLTEEELHSVQQLVAGANVDDLLRLHLGFSRGFDAMVQSPHQRAALEMLLVRLANRPPLMPVDDLLAKLSDLERRMHGARGGASRPGTGARAYAEPVSAEPAAPAPVRAGPPAAEPVRPFVPPPVAEPPPAPRRAPAPPAAVEPPKAVSAPPSRPSQPAAKPAPAPVRDLPHAAIDRWRSILDRVRNESAVLAGVLEHAVPVEVQPARVDIGLEEGSFYETQVRKDGALELITRVVREYFGFATEVTFSSVAPASTGKTTLYEIEEGERRQKVEKERREIEQHPLVQAAMRELGARITDIKLAGKG